MQDDIARDREEEILRQRAIASDVCTCRLCLEDRAEERREKLIMEGPLKPLGYLTVKPAPKEGLKYDNGKPRMWLLPFDALVWVGKVLTFGADKYAADSWRTVPNALERYASADLRHAERIQAGEWLDPESGLPHWAHRACNVLFCCAVACAEKAKESVAE